MKWLGKGRQEDTIVEQPKGFDDYDLKLGDILRGERATLGKSVLDVQRELRINANYIIAIEDCAPDEFDTPGFISGYVKSYARYLSLDPEEVFKQFCDESGFRPVHGMSSAASGTKVVAATALPVSQGGDPLFENAQGKFIPPSSGFFGSIEPGAIGSLAILIALVGTLGYGGLTVLKEIQRVKVVPVDQSPVLFSDLDPVQLQNTADTQQAAQGTDDKLTRMYRPQVLSVPVVIARDAPISRLNPNEIGSFAQDVPVDRNTPVATSLPQDAFQTTEATAPQVFEDSVPNVTLFAQHPAWVRVKANDGTVIFEGHMNAGDEVPLPALEEAPTLHAGMSGSIYFAVNGTLYGPAGSGTRVVKNVPLDVASIQEKFNTVDFLENPALTKAARVAEVTTFKIPSSD